jgi:hypothetical protein
MESYDLNDKGVLGLLTEHGDDNSIISQLSFTYWKLNLASNLGPMNIRS